MIKIVALLSVVILSSCGLFTNKVESLVENRSNELSTAKKIKKDLHCSVPARYQAIFEDAPTLKYYRPFMNQIFETKSFNFAEKAALFSLIEMTRRPDEATPFARLQYFLKYNNKTYYFDLGPSDIKGQMAMPYMKGIESLLKNSESKASLTKLAEYLDNVVPEAIDVSPEFEKFLANNKKDLLVNDALTEFFFKGDDLLTRHESFKRISFKKFIADYFKNGLNADKLYFTQTVPLQKYKIDSSTEIEAKCNFDINTESTIKEDLLNTDLKKSHYFALKDQDNLFMAVSSAELQRPFKTFNDTYFIEAKKANMPLPICQFSNDREDLVLISTEGRNPSQHIKHLISYDLGLVDSYASLEELLNFSRHLFLSSPDRILYESKRGRKAQLDFFLSMNFPIYHVESLGDIITSATFKNKNRSDQSLMVDDRSASQLWCAQ